MTNNTAPALTELEALALANVGRYTEPTTKLAALSGTPQIGDLVVIHSRGTYRLAVIEKVGPKRASVVYTTEGAIKTAQDTAAFYATAVVDRAGIEKMVRSNYRHTQEMADGSADLYAHFFKPIVRHDGTVAVTQEEQDARKAERMAEAVADLAEIEAQGGVEAAVARAIEAEERRVAHGKTVPVVARIHFTRKSVAWTEVTLPA